MDRDSKLGYGFLLMGAALPYLIEHVCGPVAALIAAIICALAGVCFLWAAHNHRLPDEPPLSRKLKVWTTVLALAVVVMICEVGWHVYVKHHNASTASSSAQPQQTVIQQQSEGSTCSNIVAGHDVKVDCMEKENGKKKH